MCIYGHKNTGDICSDMCTYIYLNSLLNLAFVFGCNFLSHIHMYIHIFATGVVSIIIEFSAFCDLNINKTLVCNLHLKFIHTYIRQAATATTTTKRRQRWRWVNFVWIATLTVGAAPACSVTALLRCIDDGGNDDGGGSGYRTASTSAHRKQQEREHAFRKKK